MPTQTYTIKQKPFSLKVRYEISDPGKNKVYEVIGPFLGNSFSPYTLIDAQENSLIFIKRTPFQFLPKFEIFDEKGMLGSIKQKFGFSRRKLILDTPGAQPYSMANNFRVDECQISRNGAIVADIKRRGFSVWRTYDVDIAAEEDVEFILGIALTVDLIYMRYRGV